MSKNKNKYKIIVALIIIIIAIAIIVLVCYFHLKNQNKEYASVDDFSSVKELVEYYNCEYNGIKNSKEENYEKDLYITFLEDPITEDGYTNEFFYENLISLISAKMEGKDYRIIDEDKNITIRIKFNDEGKISYTINNYTNYFENLSSLYTINNETKDNIIQSNIVSSELQNIINNDWIRRDTNLGEKTSNCDNYDIYWNNGYKIRTINNKIYNIIFTDKYKKEILEGITTGMTNEDVINILGDPTYEEDETSIIEIIGYKLDTIYIFFLNGEISVYRTDEYNEEDNKKFASLMTKLNETKDYNSFLTGLTNLYPDYSTYKQEENYVNIKYPLRGFEINFGEDENNGITIYNNFQGKITEDISIDDLRSNKQLPSNTYIKLKNNLVFEEEINRANNDIITRQPYMDGQFEKGKFAKTEIYSVYYDNIYSAYKFYSTDKKNSDFELRVQNATGIYSLTDNLFAYGIANDGIYVIDAYTMKTNKIVNSTGDCVIDRIEDNVIYYDNTSIETSGN